MPSGYYAKHTAANYGGGTHFQLGKSGSAIKSNGGTVFGGGNVGVGQPVGVDPATPAITNSLNWGYIGAPSRISEPLPYLGSHAGGVTIGLSTGAFSTMTAGRYIVFGDIGPNSRFIAGLANTVMSFNANGGQHPWRNAFYKYIRTTLYVTQVANGGSPGGWSYVTGAPTNRGYSYDQLNAEAHAGSYAIPLAVLFMSTGTTVTTKEFNSTNNGNKTD